MRVKPVCKNEYWFVHWLSAFVLFFRTNIQSYSKWFKKNIYKDLPCIELKKLKPKITKGFDPNEHYLFNELVAGNTHITGLTLSQNREKTCAYIVNHRVILEYCALIRWRIQKKKKRKLRNYEEVFSSALASFFGCQKVSF